MIVGLAAIVLSVPAPAGAAPPPGHPPGAGPVPAAIAGPAGPAGERDRPARHDARYLRAAHQANMAGIEAGQLAGTKDVAPQLADLGAQFVADNTQLDAELRRTAAAVGVELPTKPNRDQQVVLGRLRDADGDRFERLFVASEASAHKRAIRRNETELDRGTEPEAKQYAQESTPILQTHYDDLRALAAELGLPRPG
ncbi:hypothetical protein GCM10009779_12110 [Polymorphospora rubra]|uniref:DUF4142 domain-containing protein n=1 Tax=Polymorphospora rubra TaxID=338584 RepID=A0A810NA56_9ACTN|nr:hypothetical protein Prubr_60200 [Polymorphospora rubra]